MEQFHIPPQGGPAPGISASWNVNVLKEPRGMIRIIQLIFAILAFTTTISFDTTTSFTVSCFNVSNSDLHWQRNTKYVVEYPFDFSDTALEYLNACTQDDMTTRKLPIDFSSSAKFFVLTGILAFLYTCGAEFFYIVQWERYENNQFFALFDLAGTSVLAIFWFAGALAWAFSVSDVKYYAGPRYLIQQLPNCNKTLGEFRYDCFAESPGKWSSLYISLIFGFANFFLWAASIWFVYKETFFHRRSLQAQPVYPNISNTTGTSNTFSYGKPPIGGSWEPSAESGMTQYNEANQDLRMHDVACNPAYVGFPQGR